MNNVYDLKLHQSCFVTNPEVEVLRVPGGWIYSTSNQDSKGKTKINSTFVPYSDEFESAKTPLTGRVTCKLGKHHGRIVTDAGLPPKGCYYVLWDDTEIEPASTQLAREQDLIQLHEFPENDKLLPGGLQKYCRVTIKAP